MFNYLYENLNVDFNDKDIEKDIPLLPGLEDIEKIIPLIWNEHCLECSAPECYSSCILFEADPFNRCKRTEYGVRTLRRKDLLFTAAQLQYRKWGKLRCSLNNQFAYDAQTFARMASRHDSLKDFMRKFNKLSNLVFKSRKDLPVRLIQREFRKFSFSADTQPEYADELLLIFRAESSFIFILDAMDLNEKIVSRHSFQVMPGLNIWNIPTEELIKSDRTVHALELYPHNNELAQLRFYLSDFVTLRKEGRFYQNRQKNNITAKPADKAKCVIWDLDNTLWKGVIGECGEESIILNEQAAMTIKHLDERGVLQSICSKNDYDIAWRAICKFGLDQYFLYPQINWEPKSTNIKRIAEFLNINVDTFVLIDDSRIERQEVSDMLPGVRVYDETAIDKILEFPEFDLPVTEDAKNRRMYYLSEAKRNIAFAQAENHDYRDFIIRCGFEVYLSECQSEKDIDRCHELLQRTNQLNASTNRIERDAFIDIVNGNERNVIKVVCRDSFGEYGTVGCLILKRQNETLLCTDFVISCRIAKKKAENAIVSYLMKQSGMDMEVVYYPTARNHVLLDEFINAGGDYLADRHIIRFTQNKIKDDDWVRVFGEQKH